MGLAMLPDELLLSLSEQWPCRDAQLRTLDALLSRPLLRPKTLVVYGPHATGKSSIVEAYLEGKALRHAIVKCRECVTGRHLLERTVAAVDEALEDSRKRRDASTRSARCENLSALVVHLQRMLEKQDEFILVFDGVDKQREAPPTLLPALARLGEFIPNLTTLLIVHQPPPHFLHQTGIPHLHFPPYTRAQSLFILSRHPLDIFPCPRSPPTTYTETTHASDKAWLWPRFCAATWDSLAENAARDLLSFRCLCFKLWRPFVAPIVKGDFGTRDFSRLLVHQRRLFQDDSVLLDSIIAAPSTTTNRLSPGSSNLPYMTTHLLLAAYLASHNPPKTDSVYFMKTLDHSRRRKKRGGGTPKPRGRLSQTRKVSRHLLPPLAFTLDRLLAIFLAILPGEVRTGIDLYAQMAVLAGFRLVVRSGSDGDVLEPGGKWRVGQGVGWEYVRDLGRGVGVEVEEYLAE